MKSCKYYFNPIVCLVSGFQKRFYDHYHLFCLYYSFNKLITVRRIPLRLRSDLYCVEWGVKLYSLTHVAFRHVEYLIPAKNSSASLTLNVDKKSRLVGRFLIIMVHAC